MQPKQQQQNQQSLQREFNTEPSSSAAFIDESKSNNPTKNRSKIFMQSQLNSSLNTSTYNQHSGGDNNSNKPLRNEIQNRNIKNLARRSDMYSQQGINFSQQKDKLLITQQQHQQKQILQNNIEHQPVPLKAKENNYSLLTPPAYEQQQFFNIHYQQQQQQDDVDIEEFQEKDHHCTISTKMTHLTQQDMFSIRNVEIKNKHSRNLDPPLTSSSSNPRFGMITNNPCCDDPANLLEKQYTQISSNDFLSTQHPLSVKAQQFSQQNHLFRSSDHSNSSNNRLQNNRTKQNPMISTQVFALNLSNKRIHNLSAHLQQARNTLQILDLSNNGLNSFPIEILTLQQLVSFIANNNSICEIPLRLFSDLRLQTFSIHNNLLNRLPEQISMWKTSLQSLDISKNYLRELPEELSVLMHLESLNVSSNDFDRIPISIIKQISNMKLFTIDWFKYCSPPMPHTFIGTQHFQEIQRLLTSKNSEFISFLDFTDFFSRIRSANIPQSSSSSNNNSTNATPTALFSNDRNTFNQNNTGKFEQQQQNERLLKRLMQDNPDLVEECELDQSITTLNESIIPREQEGVNLPSNRILHHKSAQSSKQKGSLENSILKSFMDLQQENTSRFASRTFGDQLVFKASRTTSEVENVAPAPIDQNPFSFFGQIEEIPLLSNPGSQTLKLHQSRQDIFRFSTINQKTGRNLLHQAVVDEDMTAIRQLAAANPILVNSLDNFKQTPLSLSIIEEKYFASKILIFNQANVNLGGRELGGCLCIGVMKMQYYLIRDLIRFGADLNQQDSFGNTALHYIFHQFDSNPQEAVKIAQILLDNGANPNAENNERLPPLCFAIKKGNLEAVQFALAYNETKSKPSDGFSINKLCGVNRTTLLHYASELNHTPIIALLLQKSNADLFIRRSDNRIPADICQKFLLAKKLLNLGQTRVVHGFLNSTAKNIIPFEATLCDTINPHINNLQEDDSGSESGAAAIDEQDNQLKRRRGNNNHSDNDSRVIEEQEDAENDSGDFCSEDSECDVFEKNDKNSLKTKALHANSNNANILKNKRNRQGLMQQLTCFTEVSDNSDDEIEEEYINGDAPKWFYQYHSQIPYSPNNLQSIQRMNTLLTKFSKHNNGNPNSKVTSQSHVNQQKQLNSKLQIKNQGVNQVLRKMSQSSLQAGLTNAASSSRGTIVGSTSRTIVTTGATTTIQNVNSNSTRESAAAKTSQFIKNMKKCKQFSLSSGHLNELKSNILSDDLPLAVRLSYLFKLRISQFELAQILKPIAKENLYEVLYTQTDSEEEVEYIRQSGDNLSSLALTSIELNATIQSLYLKLSPTSSFEGNVVLQQLVNLFADSTSSVFKILEDKTYSKSININQINQNASDYPSTTASENQRKLIDVKDDFNQETEGQNHDRLTMIRVDNTCSKVYSDFLELQEFSKVARNPAAQETIYTEREIQRMISFRNSSR